jgi:hypothetical protein
MSAFDRQRQIKLNKGKTFINAIGVDSAKFGNEAAILASRNRTKG